MTVASLGIAGIAWAEVGPAPYGLLYNPSESAPKGWYARVPVRRLTLKTWVIARLPIQAASLAAQRHYLPATVPVLKQIIATAGQLVCVRHGTVYVDSRLLVRARAFDGAHRPLIAWDGCRTLHADEFLLINAGSESSFDSRYFGPLSRANVLANAIPLWTW